MDPIVLTQFAEMVEGQLYHKSKNDKINGISTDSRTIKKGECFVAIAGESHDGHNFIADAISREASAILLENLESLEGLDNLPGVVQVSSAISALQTFAQKYIQQFSLPLIGITGSMGKTTTKEVTAHLLAGRYKVVKSQKSFNNFLGVPLTLLDVDSTTSAGVIEVGANDFGEVRQLTKLFKPQYGIITCIAESHLAGFKDILGVEKAKSELVEQMSPDGLFATNGDDPACMRIAQKFCRRVRTFGCGKSVDYRATKIETYKNHLKFCLSGKKITVPILGHHHVYNILAGITIAIELGLNVTEIRERLAEFAPPPMRMQIEKYNDITIINDAYNASPKSMLGALEVLVNYPGKRKIAVLGEMRELGIHSDRLHLELGMAVAKCNIDQLWVVGKAAYSIASGALSGGMQLKNIRCFPSKDSLEKRLDSYLLPDDVVLLKASRKAALESVCRTVEEFTNSLVTQEAW